MQDIEPGVPVARMWRATAEPGRASLYVRHFEEAVRPALENIDGHRVAYLLQRTVGDLVEFVAITIWDSIEVVREFAGEDCERAVVDPEAAAVLEDFDDRVVHYAVRE